MLSLSRRRGGKNVFTETATFKICLHCIENNKSGDGENAMEENEEDEILKKCPELNEAMQNGKWFQSDRESYEIGGGGGESGGSGVGGAEKNCSSLTRPLKSVNAPSCGLRMQLLMEVVDN